jgi:hypothetical protein
MDIEVLMWQSRAEHSTAEEHQWYSSPEVQYL